MDPKEKFLVQQTLATLRSGTFHERDVLALLILVREHAPKHSPVREFGDFVAHRERDRGVLLEYVSRVRLALRGEADKPVPLPVWSLLQIHESLNELAGRFDAESIDAELANRITVCIVTLLQAVQIEQPQSPLSYLAMGLSSHYIALFGHGAVPAGHIFQFPLLVAENHGYEFSLRHHEINYFMRADRVFESVCTAGDFRIEQRATAV